MKDESIFVSRAALALVRLPPETESMFTVPEARKLSDEVSAKFREALDKDPRIPAVLPEDEDEPEIDNSRTMSFFEINSDQDDLTEALVRFEALQFNSPIRFRIRVLAKNQPKYRSMNDVPADDYLVVWDGIELLIQWEQSTPKASGSGGHVVFDILGEIGRAIGYPVEILACSMGCHHKFVHGDFVSFAGDDSSDHFHPGGHTPVGSTISTPFVKKKTDVENLNETYYALGMLLNYFAQAKTLFDAIEFLERRARRDSRVVLAIAYERASRRRLPNLPGAIADAWALRGSRAQTRRLLAGLWLALASIDTYRVMWRQHDLHFQERLSEKTLSELAPLFDTGRAEIEAQDLGLIRASLQEVASRMEGWLLIAATGAGAAAGIAGAAITAFLKPTP